MKKVFSPRDLAGSSYLMNVEEETIHRPPVRGLLEIIGVNYPHGNGEFEYGMYLHLIWEAAKLGKFDQTVVNTVISYPWKKAKNMAGHSPDEYERSYSSPEPFFVKVSMDSPGYFLLRQFEDYVDPTIHVLLGSVQDLISVKLSNKRPTNIETGPEIIMEVMGNDHPNERNFFIKFKTYKVKLINGIDLDAIMRGKMSESNELSLAECSLVLNPLIPTTYLRRYRSQAALVDWSIDHSKLTSESRSSISEPSQYWEKSKH